MVKKWILWFVQLNQMSLLDLVIYANQLLIYAVYSMDKKS